MNSLESIKGYLAYYRELEKKRALKENLFLFFGTVPFFLLIAIVLSNIFFFNSTWRLVIKIFLGACTMFFLLKICRDIHFWRKISFEKLAIFLEKRLPHFQNYLINAWQLSFKGKKYPASFIERLKERAVKVIMKISPSNALRLKKSLLYKKIALFSLGVFALYFLISPVSVRKGLGRIFFPAKFSDFRVGPGSSSLGKTVIKKVVITYKFPGYTRMKAERKEQDFSEIDILYGTKLKVDVLFNNPVGNANLLFSSGKLFSDSGKSIKKSFSFIAKESALFQLKYYDFIAKKYQKTGKKKLGVSFDLAPFLEFTEPGRDIRVKKGGKISLRARATDDFGITRLQLRYHRGKGEISGKDPVFYERDLNNEKKVTISAILKVPDNFSETISYYAECWDNSVPSPNLGRSSVYYIHPALSGYGKGEEELEKQSEGEALRKEVEKLKKELEKFIEEEKGIIEAAKKIGEIKDLAENEVPDYLIESEQKWAELFQEMVDDLNKLGKQTKGKFTLADELVEMISHIQSSGENLKKKAIHMAISESQVGLELAEEITSNLEKWLAEVPDYLKWDLEEPSEDYEVPEVELPDELEDIIGELIEQEEEMQEEIEDITSSWMDSLDKGAGWGVADGPISNMSAKGITGNLMPNQQEIGGRSGEGRTGRSYGEMVEKTATGKGGRKTPARVTPDNIEPGQIQDTSGETPLGPTGGGKVSGWGPEGLKGQIQDLSFQYDLMGKKQKKLIEKAEKLLRGLKVLNIYNPQLEKSISAMKEFRIQLQKGKYENLLKTKETIVSQLKQAHQNLAKQAIIKVGSSKDISKRKKELGGIWEESIPTGYEEIVMKYLRLTLGK